MDIPAALLSQVVEDGEIYYFQKGCPVGIEEHMHVCVRHNGEVLIFGTCSSQLKTALKLAKIHHDSKSIYPTLKPTPTNKFTKETYINCNNVFVVSEEKFGQWRKEKLIRLNEGKLSEEELKLIIKGVLLSDQVAEEIKDIFR